MNFVIIYLLIGLVINIVWFTLIKHVKPLRNRIDINNRIELGSMFFTILLFYPCFIITIVLASIVILVLSVFYGIYKILEHIILLFGNIIANLLIDKDNIDKKLEENNVIVK